MEAVWKFLEENWRAAAGSVLGSFVVALLGLWSMKHSRRAAAASKFRSTVLEILSGLYPVPVAWPRDTLRIESELKKRFPLLQAAVTEFEPYVHPRDRDAFREAWRRYRLGKDGRDIDVQLYFQYMPFKGTSVANGVVEEQDQTKTYKSEFKANVDRLLQFATET